MARWSVKHPPRTGMFFTYPRLLDHRQHLNNRAVLLNGSKASATSTEVPDMHVPHDGKPTQRLVSRTMRVWAMRVLIYYRMPYCADEEHFHNSLEEQTEIYTMHGRKRITFLPAALEANSLTSCATALMVNGSRTWFDSYHEQAEGHGAGRPWLNRKPSASAILLLLIR